MKPLTHDRRVSPARRCWRRCRRWRPPSAPVDRRLHAEAALDADRPDRRGVVSGLRAGAAGTGDPAAPDGLEPPRGDARGRLLDPGARGRAPTTRSARCSSRSTPCARPLREQRLGALEATALLSKVMAEIDVAVFAFDDDGPAQARQPLRRAAPRPARAAAARAAAPRTWAWPRSSTTDAPQILRGAFPGGAGRWEIRTSIVPTGRRAAPSCSCSPT